MQIEYSLNGFMKTFFRHFLKFTLVFILAVFLGIFYIAETAPTYEARGSFIVKFGQNARPDVSVSNNQRPTELAYKDRNEIINSYVKILQSQSILRQAIKDIGLEKIYPSLRELEPGKDKLEVAVNTMLSDDLRIVTSSQSNVIELYVTNKDAEIAARMTSRLMSLFVFAQARVYDVPQGDFLKEQINTARSDLAQAEKELLEFKEGVGISSIDEEMNNLLREKTELTVIAFKALTEAQQKLEVLEAQESEAAGTYRKDSSVMRRLSERTDTARKQIKKLEDELEKEMAGGTLSTRLRIINDRIASLEENRSEYNRLEQKVSMAFKNHEHYTQLFEEARANNILNLQNITRITIFDKPYVPTLPIRPRKKLILAMAILAGLIFGLAVVITFELLDERYTTPEQLSRTLGVPVLITFDKKKSVS